MGALKQPDEDEIANTDLNYNDLIKHIDQGLIHIPKFQREYVWEKEKILDLLDSIQKGYPIGSLILWITKEDFPYSAAVGEKKEESLFEGAKFFVIDGQQRLKSLYHAARSKPIITEDGEKEPVNVRYDLESEEFVFKENIWDRKESMLSIISWEGEHMILDTLKAIKDGDVEEYREEHDVGEDNFNRYLGSLDDIGLVSNESQVKLTSEGIEILKEEDEERIITLLVDHAKYIKKTLELIKKNPGSVRKELTDEFRETYRGDNQISLNTAYVQFGKRERWLRGLDVIKKEEGKLYLKEGAEEILEDIESIEEDLNNRYIPLDKILAKEQEYLEFQDDLSKERRSKVTSVRSQFKKYPFSMIIVNKTDWDTVCDIFERINTQGQQLTVVELMIAKTWSGDKFNLRESLNQFKEDIDEEISDKTILKAVSINISDKCSKEDILGLDTDEVIKEWDKNMESLRKALDFLYHDLNLPDFDIIPFPDLIVPISNFYYRTGNNSVSKNQKKKLKNWFWRASLSNRFDSAVDTKLEEDSAKMGRVAEDQPLEYDYTYPQRSVEDIVNQKYSLSNAFVKTILCMYSSLEPRNIVNSEPVRHDAFSSFKSSEMHHIFPKNYLSDDEDYEGHIDSVANIMYLPANVNREKEFKDEPSKYLDQIDNNDLESDLETHLIHNLEESGLTKDEYDKFLQYRARNIIQKLRDLAGQEDILTGGQALSPEKPFTNELHLRQLIRQSQSYVHWLDKYFTRRGLEFLVEEIDAERVSEIKILTGTAQTNHKLRREFEKFREELKEEGVDAEMRIVTKEDSREIHDRWLTDENRAFNIPSINTIGRGQHAEITRAASRPPFNEWWETGLDILEDWNEIQKHISS